MSFIIVEVKVIILTSELCLKVKCNSWCMVVLQWLEHDIHGALNIAALLSAAEIITTANMVATTEC